MCSLCMRSAWEDMNNEQKTYENYRGQERHTLPRKQQRNNEEEEATAENQAKDHCVIRKSYVSKVEGKEFIQMKKIYQDEKNMHDTRGKNNTHGRLLSLSPGRSKCFSHCSIGFVLMYT